MTKKTFLTLGAFAAVTLTSQAAIITTWDFSGVDNTGLVQNSSATGSLLSNTASGVAANATSTDIIGSAGLRHSAGAGTNSVVGELNLNTFGTIAFTLTADSGFTVDLTSIDLSAYRNGGGAPANFTFEVSIDGGAFANYGTTLTPGTPGAGNYETYSFTDTLSSVDGGTAEIRFAPTTGTGNVHINGLIVNGDITAAVPEPSSTALLGLGGLALILRRRK